MPQEFRLKTWYFSENQQNHLQQNNAVVHLQNQKLAELALKSTLSSSGAFLVTIELMRLFLFQWKH